LRKLRQGDANLKDRLNVNENPAGLSGVKEPNSLGRAWVQWGEPVNSRPGATFGLGHRQFQACCWIDMQILNRQATGTNSVPKGLLNMGIANQDIAPLNPPKQ